MMPNAASASTGADEGAMKMATEIVVAYLQRSTISPDDLPNLVRQVRAALTNDHAVSMPAAAAPGVARLPNVPAPLAEVTASPEALQRPERLMSVEESIHEDYLISFEDGRRFKSLRRHLMTQYGMTPQEYRHKWQLPDDYPMVAPAYAKERSEVAKRIGLGKASPRSAARNKAAKGGTKRHRPNGAARV